MIRGGRSHIDRSGNGTILNGVPFRTARRSHCSMTDRKKPSAAFWITVALVAVLVGYPLSFGPACWLADRGLIPTTAAVQAYHPLVHALSAQWFRLDFQFHD